MLNITSFDNAQKFLSYLKKNTAFPSTIKILEANNGVFKDKSGENRQWAHLVAVDADTLKKCEEVGLELACPKFTIKLRNYTGEELSYLVESEVIVKNYNLVFQTNRFKEPIGFGISTELVNIEEVLDV